MQVRRRQFYYRRLSPQPCNPVEAPDWCFILLSGQGASFRFLAQLFAVSPATTYQWVGKSAETLAEPVVSAGVKEIEIDQMWHFLHSKNKRWIIKALDRNTGRTVAWVVGGRDAATVRRLYGQLEHLNDCLFYTDDWEAWAKVLPPERHVIGKNIPQPSSKTTQIPVIIWGE